MKTTDYPYILLWGRALGSSSYYIDDMVARARRDKAPATAIYYRPGGWQTVEDVLRPDAIDSMIRVASRGGDFADELVFLQQAGQGLRLRLAQEEQRNTDELHGLAQRIRSYASEMNLAMNDNVERDLTTAADMIDPLVK